MFGRPDKQSTCKTAEVLVLLTFQRNSQDLPCCAAAEVRQENLSAHTKHVACNEGDHDNKAYDNTDDEADFEDKN